MNRKQFLQQLLGSLAGLAISCRAKGKQAGVLPRRRLGEDGPAVSLMGMGGFHLRKQSDREAGRMIDAALEEGVRFFDTAESYQKDQSEELYGAALKGKRSEIFLMTKTFSHPDRSAESAKRHLEGSLKRLQTDSLDLWQLHSVRSKEDVDRAFAKDGAMEVLEQMKSEGVVRRIGVTGHTSPGSLLRVLEHFDRGRRFDTMQFPINPIDFHQSSFQKQVLPKAVQRGIGVLAMKTSADGRLLKELLTIEQTVRFALSLPVSVAILGMESVAQVRQNAQLAREFKPFSAEQMTSLLEKLAPMADPALEWYKKG